MLNENLLQALLLYKKRTIVQETWLVIREKPKRLGQYTFFLIFCIHQFFFQNKYVKSQISCLLSSSLLFIQLNFSSFSKLNWEYISCSNDRHVNKFSNFSLLRCYFLWFVDFNTAALGHFFRFFLNSSMFSEL